MYKTDLKFAWRRLLGDKATTFINLISLSLGILGFLLITEYVVYEKSYDQFHVNKDRILRLGLEVYRNNTLSIRSAINYADVGPLAKQEYSEVEQFVRLVRAESNVSVGVNHFAEQNIYFADEAFFQVFSFPLLAGEPITALKEPGSAVISESVARKYFGSLECAGRRLRVENSFSRQDYLITGVFKDIPQNSHLKSEIFLSFSTFSNHPGYLQPWQWRDYYTYLLFKKNTDLKAFARKITASDFVGRHYSGFAERKMRHQLIVQTLTDIYPYSDLAHEMKATGNGKILSYLIVIAAFVLGMAWINYLNLSTAKAVWRLKEIGVRKTIGALRKDLVFQFLLEALLANILALMIAVVLFLLLQPAFHHFTGEDLSMPILAWLGVLAILMLGTLLSTIYPALILSSVSPLKALKKVTFNSAKGAMLRKALIVAQFSISMVLVIGTVIVLLQLNYMKRATLGKSLEQTVVISAPVPASSEVYQKFLSFKNELLKSPDILGVTASHVVPGDEEHWTPSVRKSSSSDSNLVSSLTVSANSIEPGFLEQYAIRVKYGRDLSKDYGTDNRSLLLTETACRRLGYRNPEEALNKRLIFMDDTFTVRGITEDFRHYSMKYAPEPYVFFYSANDFRKYSIKIAGGHSFSAIERIKRIYLSIFPDRQFSYVFADDLFLKQYTAETKLGDIISIFTALSILIASLGLFGLSVFLIQQRVKEIGIRKVLGASVVNIVILLQRDFLKLVFLALFISFPIAWLTMNNWLRDYSYRITIKWWIFACAGLAALMIAIITVSFQSVKASLANPVDNLRTE